jgi:ribosomal protein S18 acetylase RimI-like enzyme
MYSIRGPGVPPLSYPERTTNLSNCAVPLCGPRPQVVHGRAGDERGASLADRLASGGEGAEPGGTDRNAHTSKLEALSDTMDGIRIEYARRAHRGEIAALEARSFTIAAKLLPSATRTRDREPGVCLVALEGDRVVGYLSGAWAYEPPMARDRRSLYIIALAVDEGHRRRGIGRRLLSATFERAEARGGRRFLLQVQEENAGAIALYQSVGFRITQRHEDSYGPGRHGLSMAHPGRWEAGGEHAA